jgi:NADH-quinone oxidoreductase subunit K
MNLFLATGLIVFLIGAIGIIWRRDTISLFMCIEVMLNGVNLTLVTFSRLWANMHGQVAVFFVIAIAAAEAAVGFALMLLIYRERRSIQLRELTELRDLREP